MALESLKNPAIRGAAMATTPMKKIAKPEDITGTIGYLASSKLSGHVTGEVITVYINPRQMLILVREEWRDVS